MYEDWIPSITLKNKSRLWTNQIAQQLRVLIIVMGDDLSSGPRTHMLAHSYLYLEFQGTQHPILDSVDTGMCTHIYADRHRNKGNSKNYISSAGTKMAEWRHIYPWKLFFHPA